MADESNHPPWQPERGLNVSAQLQNLRNLLNSDPQSRIEHQRRLETIEQELSLRSNLYQMEIADLDVQFQFRDPPTLPETLPASSSPSSLVRSRRRAFRPSERLQRHRERYNQAMRADPSENLGPTRRATTPPAFNESAHDDYGTESQANTEQRFRAKRRKLDDGTFDDETRIISYGDEGRVTPGALRMEIIRCDGGDYYESTTGSAQFVLQDDKNVYSTKENKCNMLMKHIGGLPFSLTKIVIKAPSDGFDSPIQEGMVFVAMNDEKLLESTSQYERYSPRSYRFHNVYRRHDYYRPPQEHWNSSRSPHRPIDRSRNSRDSQPPWSRYVENDPELESSVVPGFGVTFVDPSDQEDSPSFTPRSPVSWRDLDAEYSLRSYADRYRPNVGNNDNQDRESVTSSESEDEYAPPYRGRGNDAEDLDEEFAQHRRALDHIRMASERDDHEWHVLHPSRRSVLDERIQRLTRTDNAARRWTPSRTEPRSDAAIQGESVMNNGTSSKSLPSTSSKTPVPASDVLAPHARFSMAESQTSIAINFDPPVAGRYILIKLWASCPASNIDIQCIVPHGYGGPRFFPSVEAR